MLERVESEPPSDFVMGWHVALVRNLDPGADDLESLAGQRFQILAVSDNDLAKLSVRESAAVEFHVGGRPIPFSTTEPERRAACYS